MTREVQVEFFIELPSAMRPFVERHSKNFYVALATGLSALLDLEPGCPVRLQASYADCFQLVEVIGAFNHRVPELAELAGLFLGIQVTLQTLHDRDAVVINLNQPRVTDA